MHAAISKQTELFQKDCRLSCFQPVYRQIETLFKKFSDRVCIVIRFAIHRTLMHRNATYYRFRSIVDWGHLFFLRLY
jgi:hypothetical protein